MTLAFQALVMAVLMVCGAAAYWPVLLLQPNPHRSVPLRPGLQRLGLLIVESPTGQWFVNGVPQSQRDIKAIFLQHDPKPIIHYLPSDALPLAQVSRSLQRLRSLAPGAVVLNLPPGTTPSQ